MEPVMSYQIDTTSCDVALREGVPSKVHSAVWMTPVIDILSGEIIGGESHVSSLALKAFKRIFGFSGHAPSS